MHQLVGHWRKRTRSEKACIGQHFFKKKPVFFQRDPFSDFLLTKFKQDNFKFHEKGERWPNVDLFIVKRTAVWANKSFSFVAKCVNCKCL